MKIGDIKGYGEGIIKNASLNKETEWLQDFEKVLEQAKRERDEKKLKEACREFESIFISMIFKRMRATVPKSRLIRESLGEEIFRSMLDEELARKASSTEEFGIARLLYNQLTQNQDK